MLCISPPSSILVIKSLDRCDGKAGAVETAVGYEPRPEDLDTTGLDIDEATLEKLLSLDKATWEEEVEGIEEFFKKFDTLPAEITENFEILKKNVAAM